MATRKKTPAAKPEAPAQPVASEPVQSTVEVTSPDTPAETVDLVAKPATEDEQPPAVSTPGYKAETPILHSGEKYLPGDEVPDLTPDEAARLLAQGFISLIIDGDAS